MVFSGREVARRGHGRTEVRAEPLRTRLRLSDLPTADSHLIHLTFSCSVQALDQPVERQMLDRDLPRHPAGRDRRRGDGSLPPALRGAAPRGRAQPVEHWTDRRGAGASLVEALLRRGEAGRVQLRRRAGRAVRRCRSKARRSSARSSNRCSESSPSAAPPGRSSTSQRAAELLKQFQSLREAAPGLSPGQVLDQVNPADRGIDARDAADGVGVAGGQQPLWAVAGPNLVRIDPRSSRRQAATSSRCRPTSARCAACRPARSTAPRAAGRRQSGVMFVDPARPSDGAALRRPRRHLAARASTASSPPAT